MGRMHRPRFLSKLLPLLALYGLSVSPIPAAEVPRQENLRLELARQWEAKGEYDKAVQELRLYLSEHPDSPDIYARIGGMRMQQGNFKLAGENFKIALAKNPDLAIARAGLALAYEKQGDKAKAEEERKKLRAGNKAAGASGPEGKGPARSATTAPASAPMQPAPHGTAPAAKPAMARPPADALPAPHGDGDLGHSAPASAPRSAPSAAPSEAGFSALDSGASQGAKGIYADKDFQLALELYKAGKLDAMAAPLRRCLAKNPGHPGAYYLGGLMRYDKGEFSKAQFNFKRATGYPDRGFNAHFYLGRIYQQQERFADAGKAYREYLKTTKSPSGRKQAEGYLAQMEGNAPVSPKEPAAAKEPPAAKPAAAEKPTEAAHGAKPGHAPALTEAGKPPGHGSDAAPHGDDKAQGKHADGHGEDPAKAGEGAPASKAAPVPDGKVPDGKVPAAEAKALVLGRDGDFFFLIPDENSPSGKKMHEAHLLCKAERFEKAANALKEAMLGYGGSDNADAASLDLASVYLRLGLWDAARERIQDQVGNAPRDSVKYFDAAQYLLALSHLGKRDGAKAEKALLKIKPDAPNGPSREEVEYRLTQAGALLQDSKKQAGYLEKALAGAKAPARKAGYAKQLGALHAKYGKLDKSMDWYRKAMVDCKDAALAEDCAESQLRLADLAYRQKDWKGAMDQYRKFVAAYPNHTESPWVHYQMANIYKVTNNFESALNEYKRVIDNYPDSYWASQAKWKREDTIWQKEYEEVLD